MSAGGPMPAVSGLAPATPVRLLFGGQHIGPAPGLAKPSAEMQRGRGRAAQNITMLDILYYLAVFAFVAAAIVVGGLLWRSYVDGGRPTTSFFRPRQEPRLDVVAQANVDGRRRLVLIRRDDTEHLIMTGGPVDVVIETGIVGARPAAVPNGVIEPRFQDAPPPVSKAAGE